MAAPSWKIRARAARCSLTGRPFEEGQVIYSRLVEAGEPGTFVREDFSEGAWPEIRSRGRPFSFWRSVYAPNLKIDHRPSPGAAGPGPEGAGRLLQRLQEEDAPSTEKARYILALLLERKRVLRQVGEQRGPGGRRLLVYEQLATGELLLVGDPQIGLEQVAEVELEVQGWLDPGAGAPTGNEPAPEL